MLPYFSNTAQPSEPEGWDAADVLQLKNPVTNKWSCPTMTKRYRRCENVVSQERSIRVTAMINEMAINDAAVIVRDENRELTNLAVIMLCPMHGRAGDSREKIRGVVALWKNCIKTSMRSQARAPKVRYTPRAPATAYPPSMASYGFPLRHSNAPSERTTTTDEAQIRPWSAVLETSSSSIQNPTPPPTPPPAPPPAPPPPAPANHSATLDADTLRNLMGDFNRLNQEFQALKGTNQRLRAENARLVEMGRETATEHRRAKGELDVVEDQRSVLSEQVNGLFEEINRLRAREDRHLERINALENSVEQSSRTYRRLKKVWTAASVVPRQSGMSMDVTR
ncbi:hypothetical protein DHEL01_v203235 [Diaporthe helianthi]|uniref:Uncharacterized protein n=1 Tax=Diaporthe helianthi TaxID=158607 RepID=A0A2P5I7A3_DIAHE|nr:hypothetical protein DHEL01_v203235 [Diaporthe helianthi]